MEHAHRLGARSQARLAQSAKKQLVLHPDARTIRVGRRATSIARATGRKASTMTRGSALHRADRLESIGRLQRPAVTRPCGRKAMRKMLASMELYQRY
jgi:hypothetical protein